MERAMERDVVVYYVILFSHVVSMLYNINLSHIYIYIYIHIRIYIYIILDLIYICIFPKVFRIWELILHDIPLQAWLLTPSKPCRSGTTLPKNAKAETFAATFPGLRVSRRWIWALGPGVAWNWELSGWWFTRKFWLPFFQTSRLYMN